MTIEDLNLWRARLNELIRMAHVNADQCPRTSHMRYYHGGRIAALEDVREQMDADHKEQQRREKQQ